MNRRLLSLSMAVLLTAFSLAGCAVTPTAAPTASAAATPSPGASEAADTAQPTTAAPAETVTLQFFDMPANTSGLQKSWWADIIEEKCGVLLELMPSGDQGEQKLQALMASGELPDLVVFKDKKQVEDAVRGNMLLCLDDFLDKLPNVTANAGSALQFYRDMASNGTGKAYSIPNIVGPGEVGDEINWGPFMRWDLYKKLGMPEIKTLEDYLGLMKKMIELEPTNADGQKVYGITLWKDWDGYTMQQAMQPSVLSGIDTGDQMGASLPFLQVDFHTGETMSILDPSSQYVRALKFYFQANQMGLVDPDSLTQRFDTAQQKANEGRVAFGWWPWFVGGYNTPEHTNAEVPTGYRPVLTSDYKAFWWGDNKVGSIWSWSIGANTKYIEAALKLIDFNYSTEGQLLLRNGPKGVTWDVDAGGKPYFTEEGWSYIDDASKELPGGGKLSDGISVINSAGLSGFFVDKTLGATVGGAYWDSSKGHNPTKLLQDWQSTTGYKSTSDMLKDKNMYTVTPMSMRMVASMPDDIQTLCTQIGDIVKTVSWQMVFAKDQKEFDSLLKDMTDSAQGLGLDRVITWDQAAWKDAQALAEKYK